MRSRSFRVLVVLFASAFVLSETVLAEAAHLKLVRTFPLQIPSGAANTRAWFTGNGRYLICTAAFETPRGAANNRDFTFIWDSKRRRMSSWTKPVKLASYNSINGISRDGSIILDRVEDNADSTSHVDYLSGTFSGRIVTKVQRSESAKEGTSALSPDGKCLAISTEYKVEPVVEILDGATGKLLRRLTLDSVAPGVMTFSDDGRYLAASTEQFARDVKYDSDLYVWQVSTGKRMLHQAETWSDPLFFLSQHRVFCELGWFDFGRRKRSRQVFNFDDGRRHRRSRQRVHVICRFGNRGNLVLVDHVQRGGLNYVGDYEVWDVVRGRRVQRLHPPKRHETVLDVSPDRRWLVSTGGDFTPRVSSTEVRLYRIVP